MAHAFKIMDSTGTITTYTDYDSIPLATLKHVIAFEPDLGTEEQQNEILIEPGSTVTDNIRGEEETEYLIILDGTDGSSSNAGDNVIMEIADGVDRLVPEDFADGEENHLVLEFIGGDDHIGPFVRLETGTTNVLLAEDGDKIPFNNIVGDAVGTDHYHPPVGDHHVDGDDHTEAEHREIALWNFKLQTLMAQERA